MTIKKPIKKAEGGPAAPQGGAAIADRFKLTPTEQPKVAMVGKKSALYALIAGLLGLAVAGILTYVLYQHWQFLMPA